MTISRLRAVALSVMAALLASYAVLGEASAEEIRPPDAAPGPALWQVADEDTTIYLFGTVHVLPEGMEWLDSRIAEAFAQSGELVTEVDVENQAAMALHIAEAARLADPRGLRALMSADDRRQYEDAMGTLGLPVDVLDTYEPWFAALNLSVLPLIQSGYNPASGVEMALAGMAGSRARTELETVEQQIALFDGMDLPYQLDYLDRTVEALDTVVPTVNEMVTVWLEGDADRLAAIMNSEMADGYLYDRLLIQRNANWVRWIERRLEQPGTVFVAVGAGHLAGPGSVQDQLQERGHVVSRIWR